jgi:Trm5-related predicted tRNA methylase
LRDAIELEWAGIPTATIVHEAVRGSAEAMAKLSGVPDYPFIIVDYPWTPTAIWSKEESRDLARQVAPKVRAMLTSN